MSNDQLFVLTYLFFCIIRIGSFRRRWSLPLLRGDDWFLGVRVNSDFIPNAQSEILRRYRLRLMAPFALELSALAAILLFGRLSQLTYLVIGAAVLTIVWHAFTVKVAQRQARQFELAEARQAASSVAFSLQTRRLGDYTNFKVETVIAALTLGGLGWLAYQRINDPEESIHGMFGLPFLMVYLQLGLLLMKRGLIAWRTAIPSDQANDHLEWREHVRRHYLELCDALRLIFAAGVLMMPIRYALQPRDGSWLKAAMTLGWYACTACVLIWAAHSRRVFLKAMSRSQPVKLPDSVDDGASPRGRLCYRPDFPVALIKGPRGYALNLASAPARVGAVYLAGMATLCVWIGIGK